MLASEGHRPVGADQQTFPGAGQPDLVELSPISTRDRLSDGHVAACVASTRARTDSAHRNPAVVSVRRAPNRSASDPMTIPAAPKLMLWAATAVEAKLSPGVS